MTANIVSCTFPKLERIKMSQLRVSTNKTIATRCIFSHWHYTHAAGSGNIRMSGPKKSVLLDLNRDDQTRTLAELFQSICISSLI